MQPPIASSVRIGVVGHGAVAQMRAAAVAAVMEAALVWGPSLLSKQDEVEAALADIDAVCVAVPPSERGGIAETVVRRGKHVFLEGPPAAGLPGIERLTQQAEEADIEVGVSHPLRWHPQVQAAHALGRAQLITLHLVTPSPTTWSHDLAGAADLCSFLARSTTQRVEAEAVRLGARPVACAFTLRFHNGTYAQVSLRHADMPSATLFLASPAFQRTIDLTAAISPENVDVRAALEPAYSLRALLAAETRAFVCALADGRPAPAPLHETLHTLRLLERLQARLR